MHTRHLQSYVKTVKKIFQVEVTHKDVCVSSTLQQNCNHGNVNKSGQIAVQPQIS